MLYLLTDKHIYWHVIFQIRAELQRILGEEDCCKSMKNAFLNIWKPKLLMLLKQSSLREVQNLQHIIEDREFEDEKGNSGNPVQNVLFKVANTGF